MMSFAKAHPLRPPSDCPKPQADHDAHVSDWTPYPQGLRKGHFHPEDHFLAILSLAEKATQDQRLFVEQDDRDDANTKESFVGLYQELEEWSGTLPECLKIREDASPHVLALQWVSSGILRYSLTNMT